MESHSATVNGVDFNFSGVCRGRESRGKGAGIASQRGWGLKPDGFGWPGEN